MASIIWVNLNFASFVGLLGLFCIVFVLFSVDCFVHMAAMRKFIACSKCDAAILNLVIIYCVQLFSLTLFVQQFRCEH